MERTEKYIPGIEQGWMGRTDKCLSGIEPKLTGLDGENGEI